MPVCCWHAAGVPFFGAGVSLRWRRPFAQVFVMAHGTGALPALAPPPPRPHCARPARRRCPCHRPPPGSVATTGARRLQVPAQGTAGVLLAASPRHWRSPRWRQSVTHIASTRQPENQSLVSCAGEQQGTRSDAGASERHRRWASRCGAFTRCTDDAGAMGDRAKEPDKGSQAGRTGILPLIAK